MNRSGHINHSLFWKNLAPSAKKGGNGGVLKDGPLKEAIVKTYGSVEKFQEEFNGATAGIQGSGWGWLVCFSHIDQALHLSHNRLPGC